MNTINLKAEYTAIISKAIPTLQIEGMFDSMEYPEEPTFSDFYWAVRDKIIMGHFNYPKSKSEIVADYGRECAIQLALRMDDDFMVEDANDTTLAFYIMQEDAFDKLSGVYVRMENIFYSQPQFR